jgi:Family of unknown function (DUF6522)
MVRSAKISAFGFQLEADLIAAVLRVRPEEVVAHIRDGSLTTRCEKGIDEDEGRHRLTFFLRNRQARLVIDDSGQVLHSSCIDFGNKALPRARGITKRSPPS